MIYMSQTVAHFAQISDMVKGWDDSIRGSKEQMKGLLAVSEEWRGTQGVIERSALATVGAVNKMKPGKLAIVMKQWRHFTDVAATYTNDVDKLAESKKKLTVVQRNLMLPFKSLVPALRNGHKTFEMTRKKTRGLSDASRALAMDWTSMRISLFALTQIFIGIVGLILIVDMAFTGVNSTLVNMTSWVPILGDAFYGLASTISGQGEAAWWQVLLGGLLVLLPVMYILGSTLGLVALAAYIAYAAYTELSEVFGSGTLSITGALVTFAGALYALFNPAKAGIAIRKILVWIIKGAGRALVWIYGKLPVLWTYLVRGVTWFLGSSVALIITGVLFLWAYITDRGSGWVNLLFGLIGSLLVGLGLSLLTMFAGVPVLVIAAAVFVVATFIKYLPEIYAHLEKWGGKAGDYFGKKLAALGAWVKDDLPGILSNTYEEIVDWVTGIDWGDVFWAIMEGLLDAVIFLIKGAVNLFIGMLNFIGERLPVLSVPDWVPDFAGGGSTWDMGFHIQPLAKGGIVTAPTLALIGEAGPEAVVPLDGKHGMGGITNNIHLSIDVSGVTDRSDKRALAREISDLINQEMRRMGGEPTRGRF